MSNLLKISWLTHLGLVVLYGIINLVIAIVWTNGKVLSTNFSEILVKIIDFHTRKLNWKYHLPNVNHFVQVYVDDLVLKRRNSIANALELCLFCINSLRLSDAYMCQETRLSLLQIMACRLFSTKPLSEPMLEYCQLDT